MACRDGSWTSSALEMEEGCYPSPWRKSDAAAVRTCGGRCPSPWPSLAGSAIRPPCWPSWLSMEPEVKEAWPPTRRSTWPAVAAVQPKMMKEGDGFVAHVVVVWIRRLICSHARRRKLTVAGC
ncbi:hypothetical protein ACLOJK_019782 [Asimina triloba]